MFSKYMEYRNENGLDNIIYGYEFKYNDVLAPIYPRGYCGVDKVGRPIYIERSGLIQAQKVQDALPEEELMRGYYQSYEVLQKQIFYSCSFMKQQQIIHIFNVIDLTNFSVSMLAGKVKAMAQKAAAIA